MGKIKITPISVPFPEGWQGDLDEHRIQLFSTLTFEGEGDFLFGQVGGSQPTEDIGIWINGQQIYTWDAATSTYKPIKTEEVGVVKAYLGSTAPPFYLMCDGSQHEKTRYPELYSLIGIAYNRTADDPNGASFRVPDYRGRNPRGAGTGTYDPLGGALPNMREILMHEYGGKEWPFRRETKHLNQPAAADPPGDSLFYTAVKHATLYTRSVPPYVACNFIVRAE